MEHTTENNITALVQGFYGDIVYCIRYHAGLGSFQQEFANYLAQRYNDDANKRSLIWWGSVEEARQKFEEQWVRPTEQNLVEGGSVMVVWLNGGDGTAQGLDEVGRYWEGLLQGNRVIDAHRK